MRSAMKPIRNPSLSWIDDRMKNVLVTGGAGFIGSNFVRYIRCGRTPVCRWSISTS